MPARRARLNLVNLFLWVLGGGDPGAGGVGRVPDAVRRGGSSPRQWQNLIVGRGRTGQRVRPDRPRLHARLRHPLHDQLRPRRSVHVGRLHRILRGQRPQRRRDDRRATRSLAFLLVLADRDARQHVVAILLERVAYRPLRGRPGSCRSSRHRRLAVPAVHGARLLRLRRARLPGLRALRRRRSTSARSRIALVDAGGDPGGHRPHARASTSSSTARGPAARCAPSARTRTSPR